jgi:hypothetical protein
VVAKAVEDRSESPRIAEAEEAGLDEVQHFAKNGAPGDEGPDRSPRSAAPPPRPRRARRGRSFRAPPPRGSPRWPRRGCPGSRPRSRRASCCWCPRPRSRPWRSAGRRRPRG